MDSSETWAVVELMGHVKYGGRLSEEEKFGTKMGRLDVPQSDGSFVTKFFGGSSVYSVTITTEAVARQVANTASSPAPVQPWDFPRALPERARVESRPDDAFDGDHRHGYGDGDDD